MSRLRDDFEAFSARDAVILVVGPDKPEAFQRYWEGERLPFSGLPDPEHVVAKKYHQEVNFLRLGRMPALLVVDKFGFIRSTHYARSMSDIPANDEILDLLDTLDVGIGL